MTSINNLSIKVRIRYLSYSVFIIPSHVERIEVITDYVHLNFMSVYLSSYQFCSLVITLLPSSILTFTFASISRFEVLIEPVSIRIPSTNYSTEHAYSTLSFHSKPRSVIGSAMSHISPTSSPSFHVLFSVTFNVPWDVCLSRISLETITYKVNFSDATITLLSSLCVWFQCGQCVLIKL